MPVIDGAVNLNCTTSEFEPETKLQPLQRRHCYKLYKGQSHVHAHKYFFTNRVCEVWNTLPSSVVETSSFNVVAIIGKR